MNPSRWFIMRPVATTLLMLALLGLGLLAYKKLPVAALPEVDYPTLQVLTLYPGASPEIMGALVTAPLERQLGQIPGLKHMRSNSSGGASVITLRFSLNQSMAVAEQQVQAALNAASNLLPTDLPMPPIYNKVNPGDAPIVTVAISNAQMPLPALQEWVDTRIAQKLSQIPGVGLVALAGGQRPAVRVQVNPEAVASLGLSLEDVRNSILAANSRQPKGSMDGPSRLTSLEANDQLQNIAQFNAVVVAYRNGTPIRLAEVAEISQGVENIAQSAWANGVPAIMLSVHRQPGANVVAVADRVKEVLAEQGASLPPHSQWQILTDRTDSIRAAVHDVQLELGFAILLVVLVIYAFLRNARATLIPSLVLPLALVGTFAIMSLAGFSLNNLTLMALTVATGFVVDDAIVMIENIARFRERGDSSLQAALKGSKQIAFTVISLTLSLLAVLIPLLFMEDLVGRLFQEFALTLASTIILSATISLTLTPMLCALLLPDKIHQDERPQDWWLRVIGKYEQALRWVLQRQTQTLWVAGLAFVLTLVLAIWIPKGFLPEQDTGVIQAVLVAEPDASFSAMSKHQQTLEGIIRKDSAVQSVSSFVGVDGQNLSLNTSRFLIQLKPHKQRAEIATVLARLHEAVVDLPVQVYWQQQAELSLSDGPTRSLYQMTLQGTEPEALLQTTQQLLAKMQEDEHFSAVSSQNVWLGKQAYIELNRDQLSRVGSSVAAVDAALYNAFGQRQIATLFSENNQYRVIISAQSPSNPSTLANFLLKANNGSQVPLAELATIGEKSAPLIQERWGQLPATTIEFDLAKGVALGDAVERIQALQQELHLPASVSSHFQGAALAFKDSLASTAWLMLAAVLCMYIVLGVLYESYIHPITILSTLPSAAIGALLALMLCGQPLTLIAVIGLVLLIGIVKKNAIMMIDFALAAEREQGKTPEQAIIEACLIRLRPILMTTLAALLGALPLVLGGGVGSELRQPLGIVMIGGLILSQMLTLFTTPVVYLAFERWARRRGSAQ